LGAANTAAINALITTVNAAGGGTIYFPRGTYRFAVDNADTSATIKLSSVNNIRFLGDGAGSKLLWDGALSDSGHFFRVDRGCKHITFDSLYIAEGTGSKVDPIELHHLIALTANLNSATITYNIEHIKVLNCRFGSTTGDCVNIIGGVARTAVKAAIAGTIAAGTVAGPYGQPLEATRVCVAYPASWDGGSFTITGTDVSGNALVEVVPADVNTLRVTTGEFLTITDISKSALGTTSNTASVGLAYVTQHVHVVGNVFNGFDYTNHGGNVDGENGYRSAVGAQRLSRYVYVQRNYMTGCGDQLIDFEPTGEADIGPWFIEENVVVNANPKTGQATPNTAISFWGNSEAIGRNQRSRIHRNIILSGGIGGGKVSAIDITDNIIVPNVNAGGIGVDFAGTALDVLVSGNRIIGNSTSTQNPISFQPNNNVGVDGLRVLNNTIETYRQAINIAGAKNLTIRGNRVVYKAATTNTHNAIVLSAHDASSLPLSRVIVESNNIHGDAGGGTFQYAITVQPGSQSNGSITIVNNRGTGITTRGVDIPAGTYSPVCIVGNNGFTTPTDQVKLGASVVVSIAGNVGGVAWYLAATPDPNALASLDSAPLGSLYSGQGSGAVYRKASAGASGWSTI
jgi:hypothetical protein